jgi:putative ABC transport system permease protein
MDMRSMSLAWRPSNFLACSPSLSPKFYVPHSFIGEPFSGIDSATLTSRAIRPVNLVARLKPEVTVETASYEMAQIGRDLAEEHPDTNKDSKAVVLTQLAYRQTANPAARALPILLFTVVALVLGIACVNVSNLLLSTVPSRNREMAVRVAMGAPRFRLIRQFLCESAITSSAGTLVGLWIASWCASFISSIRVGSDLPLRFNVQVDERVVAFTAIVGAVAAFLSAAVPAWRCSRGDLYSLLKSSEPRTQPQRIRGRQILAAIQVGATALVLIFSALLLKEFRLAASQYPGFKTDHVLTMALNPSVAGYNHEKALLFYAQLVERVRSIQGVRSAAIAQDKPFGVINSSSTSLTIDGYEMPSNQRALEIRSAFVTDGYFETLNIPILRGRAFDRRDGTNNPRTVIVNEAMVQRYWPNHDPIGARVLIEEDGGRPAEVIGIAQNSKYGSMSEPTSTAFLYRSYYQGDESVAVLFVQTDPAPEAMTSVIRTQVRQMDSNIPIFDVRRLEDHVNETGLLEPRFTAEIFATIGCIGLILAVLGLYGVIAYSVEQRTHEIGIRMALGASRAQVLRMVLRQGITSAGIAATAGIGVALVLSTSAKNLVSNVNPHDPTVYASVFVLILTATGLACYVPARRASLVDPNITLRS